MSGHQPSLEVECDAPAYEIVQACAMGGLRAPLDVRWCRLSRRLREWEERAPAEPRLSWRTLLGLVRHPTPRCTCGVPLPILRPAEFRSGERTVAVLFLGQCDGCNTVFWEEDRPEISGKWHLD